MNSHLISAIAVFGLSLGLNAGAQAATESPVGPPPECKTALNAVVAASKKMTPLQDKAEQLASVAGEEASQAEQAFEKAAADKKIDKAEEETLEKEFEEAIAADKKDSAAWDEVQKQAEALAALAKNAQKACVLK